jgi:hypothetical protein
MVFSTQVVQIVCFAAPRRATIGRAARLSIRYKTFAGCRTLACAGRSLKSGRCDRGNPARRRADGAAMAELAAMKRSTMRRLILICPQGELAAGFPLVRSCARGSRRHNSRRFHARLVCTFADVNRVEVVGSKRDVSAEAGGGLARIRTRFCGGNLQYLNPGARKSLTAKGRNAKVTRGVIVTVSDLILRLQSTRFLRTLG